MAKKIKYSLVALFLLGVWGVGNPLSLAPLSVLLCGLVAGYFFIASRNPEDFDFLFKIFTISLLLRVFVICLLYQLSYLPFSWHEQFFVPNDGFAYSQNGWTIHLFWESGIPLDVARFTQRNFSHPSLSGSIVPYDYWNAIVYSVVGKQPMVLFFINAVAGAWVSLFLYDLAKLLFSVKAAHRTALLTAAWPSLFFWSTQNLRESLVVLMIVQLVWALALMRRKPTFHLFCLMAVSWWGIYYLARYIFYILCMISFPLSLFFGSKGWLRLSRTAKTLFIGLMILCLLQVSSHFLLWAKKTIFFMGQTEGSLVDWINYKRDIRGFGAETAFLQNFDLNNPKSILIYLPLGLLYVFLSPFPWQMGSVQQALGGIEMLYFYFLLPSVCAGIHYCLRNRFREIVILVFFIPLVLLMLCLIEGNIGTLFRHRATIFNFFLLAAGIGEALRKPAPKAFAE